MRRYSDDRGGSSPGDIIHVLLPDEVQARVYNEEIKPYLKEGNALGFSHGFNIHFGQNVPPPYVDAYMIAPKGPGHLVRREYEQGAGVPGLVAIYQDYTGQAKDLALAYGCGIGCTRAGVIETTFQEETETDLFGEQCTVRGVTELIKAGFETLVEAGYQPRLLTFECLHEMNLSWTSCMRAGMSYMRYSISDTAEFGDYIMGPKVLAKRPGWPCTKRAPRHSGRSLCRNWLLETRWVVPSLTPAPPE